jgi:hypothetical protein
VRYFSVSFISSSLITPPLTISHTYILKLSYPLQPKLPQLPVLLHHRINLALTLLIELAMPVEVVLEGDDWDFLLEGEGFDLVVELVEGGLWVGLLHQQIYNKRVFKQEL